MTVQQVGPCDELSSSSKQWVGPVPADHHVRRPNAIGLASAARVAREKVEPITLNTSNPPAASHPPSTRSSA